MTVPDSRASSTPAALPVSLAQNSPLPAAAPITMVCVPDCSAVKSITFDPGEAEPPLKVEIRNLGPQTVRLGGLYLSRDLDAGTMWGLPDIFLDAGDGNVLATAVEGVHNEDSWRARLEAISTSSNRLSTFCIQSSTVIRAIDCLSLCSGAPVSGAQSSNSTEKQGLAP